MEPYQYPFLSSHDKSTPLYSSSSSESIVTSTHLPKRNKKRNKWKKQRQGGKPLASISHADGKSLAISHHVGDKPLPFSSHVGGKTPNSTCHVGKKYLTNANHVENKIICEKPKKRWHGFSPKWCYT